jgi:hypothetical protein
MTYQTLVVEYTVNQVWRTPISLSPGGLERALSEAAQKCPAFCLTPNVDVSSIRFKVVDGD